jgi:hypothetical protein
VVVLFSKSFCRYPKMNGKHRVLVNVPNTVELTYDRAHACRLSIDVVHMEICLFARILSNRVHHLLHRLSNSPIPKDIHVHDRNSSRIWLMFVVDEIVENPMNISFVKESMLIEMEFSSLTSHRSVLSVVHEAMT